jgi:hypothetical protein
VYVMKLIARKAITLSTLWFGATLGGSGASSGSFAGAFSSSGVKLTGSADVGAPAAGPIPVTLTTPQALTAGQAIWAAIMFNLATSQPTLCRGAGAIAVANAGLTAATSRFAVAATGQTSLPSSFTPSSLTNTGAATYWVGGS